MANCEPLNSIMSILDRTLSEEGRTGLFQPALKSRIVSIQQEPGLRALPARTRVRQMERPNVSTSLVSTYKGDIV